MPTATTRSRSWRRWRRGSTSARWARTLWRPSWCCQGKILSPVDLGAAAACGHPHLEVRRKPRVAIFPTGSELVEPGTNVKPGDIVEFNSLMLAGQVTEWGGEPHRQPITADEYELLKSRMTAALDAYDLVLVNAGSSAGSEDYTARIVGELGQVVVHGCAIRPGHPI